MILTRFAFRGNRNADESGLWNRLPALVVPSCLVACSRQAPSELLSSFWSDALETDAIFFRGNGWTCRMIS